ncbi:NTP transferase domain-containing protein [Glycomyces arizonensis]|uniref:phosphocholine cytidylyltransferase family protein n=1 Tax=Glycomyces arizonensis TaxID=256035 RepID=UPI00042446B0|nr:phosphocholine cytidylyltransferase family protein [Glycomyces arizonensis]
MRGVILAAGQGQRLRPDTDELPKTLLPIDAAWTILDSIVFALSTVDVNEIAIVVGHAADKIRRERDRLEDTYTVKITFVENDHPEWNNAYSLWTAREHYKDGAILVNGDTVHPWSVEDRLLEEPNDPPRLLLAMDDRKTLTEEAMKIGVGHSVMPLISKQQPVDRAMGEYIGVSLIPAELADDLTDALKTVYTRDRTLYYEDAFQLLAFRAKVGTVSIGDVAWTEVDDHADWALAKKIAKDL